MDSTDVRPTLPAASQLTNTVAALWPGGELTTSRRARASHEGLLAVPTIRSPRLLLPTRRAAAAKAVSRYPSALARRHALGRLAASLALRFGAGRLLSDHVAIVGSGGGITSYLSDVLGRPVVVSLGIGSDRINRKPVLGVFGLDGEPIGYAKIGLSPYTSGLVKAEKRTLAELSKYTWSAINHPRLVHAGSWNDSEVLVMSYLATSWRRTGAPHPLPASVLADLDSVFGGGRMALGLTPLWQRMQTTTTTHGSSELSERFRAAMSRATAILADKVVDVSAWHGDLTPWNLARNGGACWTIWDWERFETGVPAGLDRYHWMTQTVGRGAGLSGSSVIASLDQVGDRDEAGEIVYLLAMAERFVSGLSATGLIANASDNNVASGARIFLEALERRLRESH